MKKIAFYIESMIMGGAEKALIDLVNRLDPDHFDIYVITIFSQSVYSSYTVKFEDVFRPHVHCRSLIDNSNPFRYRLFNHIYAHFSHRMVYRALITEDFDIEIAFYEGLPTVFVAASTNRHSLKIAWLHTDNRERFERMDPAERKRTGSLYRNFHKVIGVSRQAVNSFTDFFPFVPADVILNYMNFGAIDRRAAEPAFWKRSSECEFLTVGRLFHVKGYLRLMEAVDFLVREGFAFHLTMIGEGDERGEIEDYIRRHHLEDYVNLMGALQNPYPYMAGADFFICPSYVEGFCIAAAEAIVCGCPVLATDSGGIRDVLGDSECGILEDNSLEGIIKMLRKVLTDKKCLQIYKTGCLERRKILEQEIQSSQEKLLRIFGEG